LSSDGLDVLRKLMRAHLNIE